MGEPGGLCENPALAAPRRAIEESLIADRRTQRHW